MRGQLRSGGWDYRIEFAPEERRLYAYRADGDAGAGDHGRNVTTFDDDTTQSAVRFLVRADKALGGSVGAIHEAATYALGSILKAQYPCGAWPQRYDRFPEAEKFPAKRASYPASWPREYPGGDYRGHYTLNDGVLSDLIATLLEAATAYGDERYRRSALRGGEFLLLAQMPEPQPGWAQRGGKRGIHSEHLGYILADLQFLQRAYPNATW